MKDEYDVNGGDKLIIGCKMKTVCDSVVVGNPEKVPSVDVLFNHDSILKRLNLYNAYRVISGRVKRGPGKGRMVARVFPNYVNIPAVRLKTVDWSRLSDTPHLFSPGNAKHEVL